MIKNFIYSKSGLSFSFYAKCTFLILGVVKSILKIDTRSRWLSSSSSGAEVNKKEQIISIFGFF